MNPVLRTAIRPTLLVAAGAFAAALVALALPPPPASAVPPGATPGASWPLSPRPQIVRGFEPPPKPWLPGHRGLDLAGSPGQPVLSATAGTITYAGPLAGRGVVVVTTGPLRTTYEPVIPSARIGTTVTPGQQLGTLSTAGTHCPPRPCLHWGLRQATNYLNPLTLLSTRPVRLLPQATAALKQPTPAPPLDHASATDHPVSTAGDPTISSRPADRSTGSASAAVVGIAAVLTVGGALLIRRH